MLQNPELSGCQCVCYSNFQGLGHLRGIRFPIWKRSTSKIYKKIFPNLKPSGVCVTSDPGILEKRYAAHGQ